MDDKMEGKLDEQVSWSDYPPGHVGPLVTEETSQEETVAEKQIAVQEKDSLSDSGSESDIEMDDEG